MLNTRKVCGWCGVEKDINDFPNRNKNGKISKRRECKSCHYESKKMSYNSDKDKVLARNKKYIESRLDYKKEYDRKRYSKLKSKINERHLTRYHERKNNDVSYRIKRSLRSRIYFAVTKGDKCLRTSELIGCTIEQLKQHLESLFTDGMNWENYGINGWHIDHKIPCAAFDLSIQEEQKRCFNWTNLQPLWGIDNIIKSNKIL